uniref:Uncharacterized protein n=1 Tax=Arion vulgaris TaxID=1028688 RepID=A0A0B7A9V3_9EUPU
MWHKKWLLLAGVSLGFFLIYLVWNLGSIGTVRYKQSKKTRYSVWPEFESSSPIDNGYFSSQCVKGGNYSITGLANITHKWAQSRNPLCQTYYNKWLNIFTFVTRKATLNIPERFQKKVRSWLSNNEDLFQKVYDQDVIHVVSEYTREHTIFNPLRDKRPVLPPDQPESNYLNKLMKNTAENCDFCQFKEFTAEHRFGRVESSHAFSASNIFKIDSLHALLALKKHDPLHWNLNEFLDLFDLTETWLNKAHAHHPEARYPSLVWDILPKCGASQVHPHMHVVLDFERHHGEVEAWRKGGQEYFSDHNSNYFSDLVAVYSALNLTQTYGTAVAFASLVPRKDHEVVVMAKEANLDFYTLLYSVLRAFLDDLHKMCFSMGMGLPAIGVPEGKLPAYARVITRGYITDIRADISSLEMFMATNVNIDPFKTIEIVRNSVRNKQAADGLQSS